MIHQRCRIIKFFLIIILTIIYYIPHKFPTTTTSLTSTINTFINNIVHDSPISTNPNLKKLSLTYEQNHISFLQNTSAECTLFLSITDSFPLPSPMKIALFGAGARFTLKGGTGSGDVNSHYYTTIEKSLEKANFKILSKDLLNKNKNQNEKISSLTYDTDVAIYVLSRNSGEFKDREAEKGDLFLTSSEIHEINFINEHYKKFLLVLNVCGPVDISPLKNIKNILLLSQLGVVTGDVFADILLGKSNPSGKLSTTWAFGKDNKFFKDFGFGDDIRYKEGIYVGYRYYDSVNIKPLYPFGFGLSYTKFNIEKVNLSNNLNEILCEVKVTNIGNFIGKEVIQIYISPSQNNKNKPYQSLIAFKKTKNLNIKENEILKIKFKLDDISRYDEENSYFILDNGNYIIRVGNSSNNTQIYGYIYLEENIILKKLKKLPSKIDFEDFSPEIKTNTDLTNIQKITLTKNDFKFQQIQYNYKYTPNNDLSTLSNNILAKICMGNFNRNFHVSGISGETVTINNKYLTLCDGPAGIRIPITNSQTDHNKKYDIYTSNKFSKKNDSKIKNNINLRKATAFPIATALAQSFNIKFVEKVGYTVGTEMEIFDIDIWLAPGMNIHRNILCGRNFEYFSEDPILSGKIAAAMTRGVQKHKNKGVTIKHFTCNNQETFRYYSNSMVSERALREIYLKGFQIAIEESKPVALMTSYNLLNGKHTSENRDLLEDVLRNEWNFQGLIMSDWYVSNNYNPFFEIKYKPQHVIGNILAGNDLQMPGYKEDYDIVIDAVKSGEVKRENLMECASKVYDTIMMLNEDL